MLLLWLSLAHADSPSFDTWVARGDTAAADLAAAANRLAETAREVRAAGRAERFPELHAQATEVVRRADLLVAALAADPEGDAAPGGAPTHPKPAPK